MKLLLRILALLVVVPATYYFVYWVPFSLIPIGEQRWIASVVSLACAVGAGWFVWGKLAHAPRGVLASMLIGAVLVGGIGFVGGFFGPLIFTPESNQGPLMGLFITGPLGFLVGAIGGLVLGIVRRKGDQP